MPVEFGPMRFFVDQRVESFIWAESKVALWFLMAGAEFPAPGVDVRRHWVGEWTLHQVEVQHFILEPLVALAQTVPTVF